MLSVFIQKYRKWIVTVIIIAILLLGYFIYYTFFVFHISSIDPNTNAVPRIAPVLRVSFSKPITKNNLSITTNDSNHVAKYDISNGILQLYLTNIDQQTDKSYSIVITSVSSTTGDTLHNATINFHTSDIAYDQLSKDDQKLILQKGEANDPSHKADPATNYLPHSTLDYEITYTEPKIITVTLDLTSADVRIDKQGAIDQYTAEANAYLQSLHLDLSKYTINYVVDAPVL